MEKLLDFLISRTFFVHVTGLLSILGAGWAIPNSQTASLAIAAITGITQAAHAYKSVREQPTLGQADVAKAVSQ